MRRRDRQILTSRDERRPRSSPKQESANVFVLVDYEEAGSTHADTPLGYNMRSMASLSSIEAKIE